jgi:hypothetical protein
MAIRNEAWEAEGDMGKIFSVLSSAPFFGGKQRFPE